MRTLKFLLIGFITALSFYGAEANAAPATKAAPQQRVIVRTGPNYQARRQVVRRRVVRRYYGRPVYRRPVYAHPRGRVVYHRTRVYRRY
jgi:hypothetical protein